MFNLFKKNKNSNPVFCKDCKYLTKGLDAPCSKYMSVGEICNSVNTDICAKTIQYAENTYIDYLEEYTIKEVVRFQTCDWKNRKNNCKDFESK